MPEISIKEKRQQIDDKTSEFMAVEENRNNIESINRYIETVVIPQIMSLETECGQIGHVNLQTLTVNDEFNTQYYICDNCRKTINL
jgi:hypothetical protein